MSWVTHRTTSLANYADEVRSLLLLDFDMPDKEPCPIAGCPESWDKTSVFAPILMQRHLDEAHPLNTKAATKAARVKAEDVDGCISVIDKGQREMSRQEWKSWLTDWRWWRKKQPKTLDLTACIVSKFPRIRNDITSMDGADDYNEEQLLEAIGKMMLKDTNLIRQREALQAMKQNFDESISSYAKRLKAAAAVCDFMFKFTPDCDCNCTYNVSYTEYATRDVFFLGLNDKDLLEQICLKFQKSLPSGMIYR